MNRKDKIEAKFLALLKSLPEIEDEKELIIAMMVTMAEMSNRLLKTEIAKNVKITATAAYLARTSDIYIGGCRDVAMASLSSKTQLIDKFENQRSD